MKNITIAAILLVGIAFLAGCTTQPSYSTNCVPNTATGNTTCYVSDNSGTLITAVILAGIMSSNTQTVYVHDADAVVYRERQEESSTPGAVIAPVIDDSVGPSVGSDYINPETGEGTEALTEYSGESFGDASYVDSEGAGDAGAGDAGAGDAGAGDAGAGDAGGGDGGGGDGGGGGD